MACNCCGGCACKAGELPYTMTVRLTEVGAECLFGHETLHTCSDMGSGAVVALHVKPQRIYPLLNLACEPGSSPSASPAVLEYVLTDAQTDDAGNLFWAVESISAASPGAGYEIGFPVTVSGAIAYPTSTFEAEVSAVDVDGGIVSITVADGGMFYRLGNRQLSQAVVLNGGCGYATYGRSAPSLTAVAKGAGSGAAFSVSTVSFADCNGDARWEVSDISVDGGAGYKNFTPIAIRTAPDDSCIVEATAYLYTEPPEEPELSVFIPGGKGAAISVDIGPTAYGVKSATVASTYGPCSHGSEITFSGGGKGYVLQDAAEPTLTLAAQDCWETGPCLGGSANFQPPTSGDVFSYSLTETAYDDGEPYYLLTDIAIEDGGEFATAGSPINATGPFGYAVARRVGTVASVSESVRAITGVTVCGGTVIPSDGQMLGVVITERGANGSPTFSQTGGCPGTFDIDATPTRWGVSAISVTEGGTGYRYGTPVQLTLGENTITDAAFSATIKTIVAPPDVLVSVTSASGSNASIVANLTKNGDWWEYGSVVIASGGIGYAVGDKVVAKVVGGTSDTQDPVFDNRRVTSVGAGGAIFAIGSGGFGGRAHKDTGVVKPGQVAIANSGSYYKYLGIPKGVRVTNRGAYFRVDPEATPRVANIAATRPEPGCLHYDLPHVTLHVEDDPGSALFGRVVSAEITHPGVDLASDGAVSECELASLLGNDVVVHASPASRATFINIEAPFGQEACATVNVTDPAYDGVPSKIYAVDLVSGGLGYAQLGRVEPTLSLAATAKTEAATTAWNAANTFSCTTKSHVDSLGRTSWAVDGVTVASTTNTPAGVAYLAVTNLLPYAGDVVQAKPASIKVARTKVGEPAIATVLNGGSFYVESKDATPYVADVTVSVSQTRCGEGSGAELSAVVNADPYDEYEFGAITKINVDAPGSGYTLLSGGCFFTNKCYETGGDVTLSVPPHGPMLVTTGPISMQLTEANQCAAETIATAGTVFGGTATATVTRGGRLACGPCVLDAQDGLYAVANVTVTMRDGSCAKLGSQFTQCVAGDFSTGDFCLAFNGAFDSVSGRAILFAGSQAAETETETVESNPDVCPTVSALVTCSGETVRAYVSVNADCRYCWPQSYNPSTEEYSLFDESREFSVVSTHDIPVTDGALTSVEWEQDFDLFTHDGSTLGASRGVFTVHVEIVFGEAGSPSDPCVFP